MTKAHTGKFSEKNLCSGGGLECLFLHTKVGAGMRREAPAHFKNKLCV